MHKIYYIVFLFFSICLGNIPIHPIAKSFFVPGLGERTLGYHKSAKFFLKSEIILLTGCYSAFKISNIIEDKYVAYAAEHAGSKFTSDHRYWVDIGNYNSNIDFDNEHLRMRDSKEGQWSNHPWDWQNDNYKRAKFENMRIESDKYFLAGKFLIGGVILNHIISSINTLYIIRLNEESKISLVPSIERSTSSYKYVLSFYF